MRDADVDCGTMWASPHLLLASHQRHCDGTTLHHDMISMNVYTFTYSDDYDIPDIHGWNYYIMDDFFSIIYIYSWYLEWLCFACIARQIFFANGIQMAHGRALLWISMANPLLCCAMRKCGSRDFKWLIAYWPEAKCLLHLSIGMCYDLLFLP